MSDLFPKEMLGESEQPSAEDQAEMQELAILVAKALAKGESTDSVIADLTNNGFEPEEAAEFVYSVEYQLMEAQERHNSGGGGGGEGSGWLLWIGGILLINFLSYIFGWGFWIY